MCVELMTRTRRRALQSADTVPVEAGTHGPRLGHGVIGVVRVVYGGLPPKPDRSGRSFVNPLKFWEKRFRHVVAKKKLGSAHVNPLPSADKNSFAT